MGFKELAVFLMLAVLGAFANHKVKLTNCESPAIRVHRVIVKSRYPVPVRANEKIVASGSYYNGYGNAATRQSRFKVEVSSEKRFNFYFFTRYISLPDITIPEIKCGDIPSPIPLCPGPSGNQTFNDVAFTIPASFLPSNLPAIAKYFGSSYYKATVKVRDQSNRLVVCINAEGEIKL